VLLRGEKKRGAEKKHAAPPSFICSLDFPRENNLVL